jgi:hypothetical protein
METTQNPNTERGDVRSIDCSAFFTSLRTHWNNWWNRGTAKAYQNLTQAMRNDPMYAHSWQCNIAMPIYDGAKGKLTIEEANKIADNLMKHLFDVPNGQALSREGGGGNQC